MSGSSTSRPPPAGHSRDVGEDSADRAAHDEPDPRHSRLPSLTLSLLSQAGESSGDLVPIGAEFTGPAEAAATGGAPGARPRGARTGDVIGNRYVVEGQLGRGGMGRVMRVRHRVLGKAFALKLIKAPIATDPRMRELFYREARLASALTHDNICSIVDFGLDRTFGLFMVMELLDGQTVRHKLHASGRMPAKVACDVMWQVTDAVRYIHGRAIIHGDLKTENIYLTRSAVQRRGVKLLDFGLARPDLGRGVGAFDGTPEYLAPERTLGGAATVASDLYALGIVFFELLTGDVPFQGDAETVFAQHRDAPMPVPSRMHDDALDERADSLVARATDKDPQKRHADVGEFMYELRTLMRMIGGDGRRRGTVGGGRRELGQQGRAGAELFWAAPMPMAACDAQGKVRVANAAFLEFLGVAGDAGGLELADSGLIAVYPKLLEDLATVHRDKELLKRVLFLTEGGGATVEAAVILTPAPDGSEATGGDIHLCVHPLRTIPPAAPPARR